jgi:hypothetical protein
MDEMNESSQAAKLGVEYLQAAERTEQGYGVVYVLMPLCVAQARSGHPDAVANAERAIAIMRNVGTTGLNLGLAYEARARVALAQDDRAAWEISSARCDEVYSACANPTLLAKSRRLQRDAQKKALVPAHASLAPATQRSIAVTVLKSKLRGCADAEARAKVALRVLADLSGASSGLMYLTSGDGLVCAASMGALEPTEALHAMAREYIAGETHGHDVTTGSDVETLVRPEWTAVGDATYRPVLLSHHGDSGYAITGLAVFEVAAGQSFTYPGEAAARLSRLAVENKDATPIPRFDD